MATQFEATAKAFIDGERLNSPVDRLVQYPQRGDVPARLAGVVVGIVEGTVYVREITDLVSGADSYVLGMPSQFEFATRQQEADAGRYLARALSVAVRLDGGWSKVIETHR